MNNDLISREALKEAFEEVYPLATNEMGGVVNRKIYEIINNAPPIEITEEMAINKLHETGWLIGHDKEMTTRPQGEWIKEPNGKTTDIYRCSICGRSIMLCKDADLSKYPFCHCGADMRKGGKE